MFHGTPDMVVWLLGEEKGLKLKADRDACDILKTFQTFTLLFDESICI